MTDPQIEKIKEEFEKKIAHDDWCKTVQYPGSSWDCNCYMKDCLAFLTSKFTEVKEAGRIAERKEFGSAYEKGRAEMKQEAIAAVDTRHTQMSIFGEKDENNDGIVMGLEIASETLHALPPNKP